MGNEKSKTLGQFFTQSVEKGVEGLPLLSVTLDSGLVTRDSLERKMDTNLGAGAHLLVRKGDISYNMMRIWQGALGRSDRDGLVSPAYVVLRAKPNIDSFYAEYLFKTPRVIYLFWAYSYGLTNDRLRLYYRDFSKISVLIPPLAEQQKIAQILSTWDQAITTTEQLLANSQQQKKALMQQLLTGKHRYPEFSQAWIQVRLGDVAHMRSGGTPKSTDASYYGGDIPWVSISDMTKSGKYISKTDKQLTEAGILNSSAKIYPKNTILYAMYASIGECSIATVELASSQAILGIQPKEGLNYLYLYYYLSFLKEKIKLQGQQGAQSNLNAGMVKNFTLFLPPMVEQKKIVEVLSILDQEIAFLQKKQVSLNVEKQALMQQLLTGQRRVI